jgi:hypothetical protein
MPEPEAPTPGREWRGYREYIGPNGAMVLYQPSFEELVREQQQACCRKHKTPSPFLPAQPGPEIIPAPQIPRHKWSGYREYIGPHGEMVLYQPTIEELLGEDSPPAGPAQPVTDGPAQPVPPASPATPAPVDAHPHTVARPNPNPPAPPKPQGNEEPAAAQPPDRDIDEEMRRHWEWLRHRFDGPPQPPRPQPPKPPDPTHPGSYKRLRDEADETARRIRQIEDERWDSVLPDWLWDQLYGAELRMLITHLRSIRWQIEEFERAWYAGEDPVEAVNRYNRQQWEIFLRTMQEHIQLLGQAILNVEIIRGLQRAAEEALRQADAARRARAQEWIGTRERARQNARRSNSADRPPAGLPADARPQEKIGGLTKRQWERIRARKLHFDTAPGSDEEKAATDIYRRYFSEGDESRYGQTFGTVELSEDGQHVIVQSNQISPEGVVTPGPLEIIPVGDAPVQVPLQPGVPYPWAISNIGPQ